jgi:mannose-6-phosphate isomerase
VIHESQAQDFSYKFFEGIDVNILKIGGKLSPKILIVKVEARLSWQYHNRRAEIWQHTDATYPSNEDDIIRVQDDFGR